MSAFGIVLVIGAIALGLVVLGVYVWSIVLLFKDETPGRALFIWLLTPLAVVVLALVDSTREFGSRKTWLGFSKQEFDAMLASKRA